MNNSSAVRLFPEISSFLEARKREFDQIPETRRKELSQLAGYVRDCLTVSRSATLLFLCTHNSRRSHLCQIWAEVAAEACGLMRVETYSGGTEATAMNPRVVDSLRRCGFRIEVEDPHSGNPTYIVYYAEDAPPMECFSKVYDQSPNPTARYGAVMTCSEADSACPIVPGSDFRSPIRYEDPKIADGTPEESAVYDERSRQICREMIFLMLEV